MRRSEDKDEAVRDREVQVQGVRGPIWVLAICVELTWFLVQSVPG